MVSYFQIDLPPRGRGGGLEALWSAPGALWEAPGVPREGSGTAGKAPGVLLIDRECPLGATRGPLWKAPGARWEAMGSPGTPQAPSARPQGPQAGPGSASKNPNSLLPAHRHAVDAEELEAAHGEPGKYTEGLMMREWSACDEDEDVVTMALTAVRRLVERCGVRWEDIGMLQVWAPRCACAIAAHHCASSLQHVLRTSCACTG